MSYQTTVERQLEHVLNMKNAYICKLDVTKEDTSELNSEMQNLISYLQKYAKELGVVDGKIPDPRPEGIEKLFDLNDSVKNLKIEIMDAFRANHG